MNNQRKVVLCDMDGVLVDLLPTWLRIYGERTGEMIRVAWLTSYEFNQYVSQPKEFQSCLAQALIEAPLMSGADTFDKLFTHLAFDTYIVTYAHESAPYAFQAKLNWLSKYFPKFDRNKVIFTKHKHLVRGDFLIEDSPENLQAWKEKNPEGVGYLIKHPYNQGNHTIAKAIEEIIATNDTPVTREGKS